MKKLILTLTSVITLGVTTQLNAQKIGVKGGVNFSNQSVITEDGKAIFDHKDFKVGYNVGITAGFDFNKFIGLETGLELNSRGYEINAIKEFGENISLTSIKNELDNYEATFKRDLLFLDIPVLVKAMVPVTNNTQLYAKAGPYIGIGLSGKEVIDFTKGGETAKNTFTEALNEVVGEVGDVAWGSENDELKRLDFGFQFGLGTEIHGFLVEANYKLGLTNLNNVENVKTFNHVIGVSVGYNLDFKKLF